MSFGKKLAQVRKKQRMSQSELAKKIGTQAPVIGRYEREEAKPSIEVASNLAAALKVSLDYLVGYTELELDVETLKRIEHISKMSSEEKAKIFMVMDALIRDFQFRNIAS